MKVLTKTAIWVVCMLLMTSSSYAKNFLILESQSYHPFHKMDEKWEDVIINLGHQANIIEQTALNDLSNIAAADVLIISSALIGLPPNRIATIEQFVKDGGHVYIQSEYLLNHPGTKAFKTLVNNLGGSFEWNGSSNGGLVPMEVLAPVDGLIAQVNDLNYFWYGAYGSGDNTIFPYLRLNDLDYGFVFSSTNPDYGKIVTNSDQDWVRENYNTELLTTIISIFTFELPEISISSDMDNPCPNSTISFQINSSESLAEVDIEWLINGMPVLGENGETFQTDTWLNGDQIIAKISGNYFNDVLINYSTPIDVIGLSSLSNVDLQIEGPQSSVCETETINFNAIVNTNDIYNLNYSWVHNGQVVSGATGATFSPTNYANNDVVSCVLTYDELCNIGATVSSNAITIAATPASLVSVDIQADALVVCDGTTVNFTAQGTNLGSNPIYQWRLNGNPVGSNAATFAAQNLTENATVTCLVQSSMTCVSNEEVEAQAITIEVEATVHPTIAIIPSVWTACENQDVVFSAVGSDMGIAPSFQWLVDGNPVGTNSSELILNNLQDGQSVSCILHVAETCVLVNDIEADAVEMEVINELNPQLNIVSDITAICAGETVVFTASSTEDGGNPNYTWLIDGNVVAQNQTVFSTSELAPNQSVVCQMTVNSVCTNQSIVSSNAIEIEVTPQLNASLDIQLSKNIICLGDEVVITAIGENLGDNPIYQWSINGNTMNSYSPTWTTNELSETTIISCIVSSDVACVANPVVEANPVTVELSSLVINVLELEKTYCDNEEGLIEVIASGGQAPYEYKWNIERNGSMIQGLAAGTYVITVTDGNGCEISSTIQLENVEAPVIEEVVTTAVACNGVFGTARVFVEDFLADYEYSWVNEFGTEVGDKADAFDLSAGTYEVIVSSAPGCSVRQSVVVGSVVSLEVVAEELVEIKLGEETDLTIYSAEADALSYTWSPATALSCTDCASPIANPTETTTYTVTVSNAEGCVQRLEILVAVDTHKDLYIPNAFSPNNDGVNDFFMIYGGNKVERIKSFQVFNRWGATIYKAANFMPNDQQYAWNGKAKNQQLGRDVFVYVVEVEFIDGKTEVFKGDVTIVD